MTMPSRADSLLNRDYILGQLTREAPYSQGHGAAQSYLGAGLLYYTLSYLLGSQINVCIGSGGGFVPRMMRQAQRDLGGSGKTYLVDANLPALGWGRPYCLAEGTFFKQHFGDVIACVMRSDEAARTIFPGTEIDYLHIDGDHSYEGCLADFENYSPLLSGRGLVTIHDTALHRVDHRCGVHRAIDELRRRPGVELLNLPYVGKGVCILRLSG